MTKSTLIYLCLAIFLLLEVVFLGFIFTDLNDEVLIYIVAANALAFIGALFANPMYFGWLLLAWLPFDRSPIKIEIGIVTWTPYTAGIMAVALLGLYRNFAARSNSSVGIGDLPIITLCAIYLVSTLLSESMVASGYLAFHAIFIPVVSYFTIKVLINSEREYRNAVAWFIGGLVLFSLVAVWEFVLIGTERRVTVLGRNSIAVASFGVIVFCFCLFGPGKKLFGPRFVAGLIGIAAIGVSFSRAFLLGMLISPVLYLIVRKGYAVLLLILFLGSSFVITMILVDSPQMAEPRNYSTKYERTVERVVNLEYWKAGIHSRLPSFQQGLRDFQKSPIFGTGLVAGQGGGSTTHNMHIEWLQYGGITGYTIYALVFIVHFWRTSDMARRDRLTAINLLLILLILINGFMNGLMHGVMPYLAFILIGLTDVRVRLARNADRSQAQSRDLVPERRLRPTA